MESARGVVDFEAAAERIQIDLGPGELAPGQGHGVDRPVGQRRPVQALQFRVEEAQVELGVVNHQGIAGDEGQKVVHKIGEDRVAGQKFGAEPVDPERALRHVALRIDVSLKMDPRGNPVFQFQAGDFHDAVPAAGVEARGLGVEDDLTHGGSHWASAGAAGSGGRWRAAV